MEELNTDTTFSPSEWLRYTRHVQLPQVGAKGQQRLKQAKVLIVGTGGLGAPVSLYLAAAGVGQITLVDGDVVDVTNLQRQIIFSTQQVGHSKAESAQQKLMALNPEIEVIAVTEYLTADNASQLVSSADLVLDCTDNFSTRYLINDVCIQHHKPWVFSAIHQFSGQCSFFSSAGGCFKCLFPEPSSLLDDCNSAGVLGVLPGILGTIQANEALKYLIGQPVPLKDTLLLVDALELNFKKIGIRKDTQCAACGSGEKGCHSITFASACSSNDSVDSDGLSVSVDQFEALKKQADHIVLDVRTDAERAAFNIGGGHTPLDGLQDMLDQLDHNKVILCYCQSGLRGLKAAQLLASRGIKSKNLHGGLASWLKQTQ